VLSKYGEGGLHNWRATGHILAHITRPSQFSCTLTQATDQALGDLPVQHALQLLQPSNLLVSKQQQQASRRHGNPRLYPHRLTTLDSASVSAQTNNNQCSTLGRLTCYAIRKYKKTDAYLQNSRDFV